MIRLICLEWNAYNGFILQLLHLEFYYFESALLGFNFSMQFLYIDILWISIKVFDKTD